MRITRTKLAETTLMIVFLLKLESVTSNISYTNQTPHSSISYPHFQHLNINETISGTKPRQSKSSQNQEYYLKQTQDNGGKDSILKLKLVQRDKVSQTHETLDHRSRFKSQIRRDAIRVAQILHRLDPDENKGEGGATSDKAIYGVDDFGSVVVSGMDQGSGEYFVRIGVGSPPRSQYMVVDSGSDIVWVQCQPCSQCYRQSDPLFDPAASTSYTGVSCSSAVCNRFQNAGCHAGRCRYEVSYGDGSYTKGTLALETLTFGGTTIRNVAIGCGHKNQGMFVGAAGLLGLGSGPMSFVGQLGSQTGGAFSYCLVSRSMDSSGSLEFGRGAMPVGATWVPLIKNPQVPSFYYIGLSGLGVGGIQVPISEDVFRLTESGSGGVVMDTGTAVTRFPTAAYNAFRDAFVAQTTNLPRASKVSIFDTCYDLFGFLTVRVPTVSFYFSGGLILTLPARNFLIPVDEVGTFCFAFAPTSATLSIIGNIQQEGIQISIDGSNGYVGFGPNVC